MTVRRHLEDYFYATPAEVAEAVRWVLGSDPPYSHTVEQVKNSVFKTTVKPSWFFRGTGMTVRIQPQYEGTRVIADTKSQFFIMGDFPGFYNRYLHDFLRDVRIELQRQELLKQGMKV
jgi:hypothetical protein